MITITIKKPIYGTYLAVRDKYLKGNKPIKIRCGDMVAIVTPREWKKTGTKIKKVFLIPNHPMTFWANHLSRFVKKEEPKVSPLNTLYSMPAKYRNRIRKMLKVKYPLTKSV